MQLDFTYYNPTKIIFGRSALSHLREELANYGSRVLLVYGQNAIKKLGIYDKSGIKYKMAQNINDQLESVGFVNLGVKERPGLVVLRRTQMPAVLVEVGFINSDVDNQIFDNNFNDIALAITQGILDTLDLGGEIDNDVIQPFYSVQTGAFRNRTYANRLLGELRSQDFPAELLEGNDLYRVNVGSFETLDEAVAMERRLKRAGYQTVIVIL